MDDTNSEGLNSETEKARGLLMTFSTLVLLGWYFGAELSQVSILGNSIKLQQNTDNVWLILSIGSFYFLLRYVQKLSPTSLKPDDKMRACYESSLIAIARYVYKRQLREAAQESFVRDNIGPSAHLTSVHPTGEMKHVPNDGSVDDFFLTNLPELKREHENRIIFSVPYRFKDDLGRDCTSSGTTVEINPHRPVVIAVAVYSFAKGIVLTPWLSERVLPIFYGLAVLAICLYSWIAVKWL
ncbi:hypothetical protein [Stutzerimonas stutzeri]|uniref:hypothetical protein n=1 Tax=Stutzerimonas stutzeri TaxID=316 RepID=UPI0006966C8D|nr:hypothetical protein [Stutzerimonas stutzeri]